VSKAASSSAISRPSAGAKPGRAAERRSLGASEDSIAARISAWRWETLSARRERGCERARDLGREGVEGRDGAPQGRRAGRELALERGDVAGGRHDEDGVAVERRASARPELGGPTMRVIDTV
jgi:hypothetical protein